MHVRGHGPQPTCDLGLTSRPKPRLCQGLLAAADWVDQHFVAIQPEEGGAGAMPSLDWVLAKARAAVALSAGGWGLGFWV
jgi:hypothetical protein